MHRNQEKAMFAKQKSGELIGKRYRAKKTDNIIDYRKKFVKNLKGRRIGRFHPSYIQK